MIYSFRTHLGLFVKSLYQDPLLLLAIQLPQILLVALQWYTDREYANSPFQQFLINYPVYCIVSVLCSCLTYRLIKSRTDGTPNGLGNAGKQTIAAFWPLLWSSLLVGLVLVAGFGLLIAPGIYLMSLYLFVPFILVDQPETPVMKALYQSTALAKRNLKLCLVTSLGSFLLTLGVYLTGQGASELLRASNVWPFFLESTGSILCAITLDTWLSHLYLMLNHE